MFEDQIEQLDNKDDINATANAKRYYRSCLDEKTIEEKGEQALLNVIKNDLGSFLKLPSF